MEGKGGYLVDGRTRGGIRHQQGVDQITELLGIPEGSASRLATYGSFLGKEYRPFITARAVLPPCSVTLDSKGEEPYAMAYSKQPKD